MMQWCQPYLLLHLTSTIELRSNSNFLTSLPAPVEDDRDTIANVELAALERLALKI